jgi:hypothetical protein
VAPATDEIGTESGRAIAADIVPAKSADDELPPFPFV